MQSLLTTFDAQKWKLLVETTILAENLNHVTKKIIFNELSLE